MLEKQAHSSIARCPQRNASQYGLRARASRSARRRPPASGLRPERGRKNAARRSPLFTRARCGADAQGRALTVGLGGSNPPAQQNEKALRNRAFLLLLVGGLRSALSARCRHVAVDRRKRRRAQAAGAARVSQNSKKTRRAWHTLRGALASALVECPKVVLAAMSRGHSLPWRGGGATSVSCSSVSTTGGRSRAHRLEQVECHRISDDVELEPGFSGTLGQDVVAVDD